MQQFLVPQFIDVEDKIIGPITTRQFVILLAAILLGFIFYKVLNFFYAIFVDVIIMALAAILAFVKINGRPIHFFLLNFIQTFRKPKLRVWEKNSFHQQFSTEDSEIKEKTISKISRPPVTGSRLADLSLVINTGGVYGGENGENQLKNL